MPLGDEEPIGSPPGAAKHDQELENTVAAPHLERDDAIATVVKTGLRRVAGSPKKCRNMSEAWKFRAQQPVCPETAR
jgi:hypothetical protein